MLRAIMQSAKETDVVSVKVDTKRCIMAVASKSIYRTFPVSATQMHEFLTGGPIVVDRVGYVLVRS